MVDGVKFFQSRVARRPVCNTSRSRCESTIACGTLGVMMFDPPQESWRSKITPRNRTSELRNLYITDAAFRGLDEYPFAAKVLRATLAAENMTVKCRTTLNVVDGSLQLSFNQAHVRTFTTDL
ncbi:hypothetical protein TNCV_4269211 [Trichonephila clavipes]|nr:hypothetical protein TNCV_4269211 [Trichonephila clavipes]